MLHVKYGTGADPGILNQGFKLAEGGSICAVWPIFPEIPHENEIVKAEEGVRLNPPNSLWIGHRW